MPTCVRCEAEKPESEFRVRPDRNNWRVPNCRECERAIQLENYYRAKSSDPQRWRIAVMRNNRSKEITAEWLAEMLERQNYECALSGRPIDIMSLEIDHIVPSSKGGTDDLSNLRLVCREANMAKYTLTDAEFIALCHDVVRKSSAAQSCERKE